MSTTISNALKRYLNEIGSAVGKSFLEKLSNSSAQTTTPTSTPTPQEYVKTDWDEIRNEAEDVKNAAIKDAEAAKINSQVAVDQAYSRLLKEAEESYEKDSKTANARLKAQLGALLDAKSKSEQTANINYQKLLKYLPERLSAQGLSGLGTSQGAYIRATNDLNNRFVDIMGKYTEGRTAAEDEHGNAMSALRAMRAQKEQAAEDRRVQDTQRLEDRYSIDTGAALDRYNAKMDSIDSMEFSENQNINQMKIEDKRYKDAQDREDANRRTEQAAELIQNGYFESSDELKKWYDANKNNFGANNDYINTIVQSTLNGYKKIEEEEEWNNAAFKANNEVVKFDQNYMGNFGMNGFEDTFWVEINGEDVKLEADDETRLMSQFFEDESIPEEDKKAIEDLPSNSFYIYNNRLFFKTFIGSPYFKDGIVKIKPDEHSENYQRVYNEVSQKPRTNK